MSEHSRREFMQISAGALAVGLNPARAAFDIGAASQGSSPGSNAAQKAPSIAANEGKKPLRLGLIIHVGKDPDQALAKLQDLGLPTAQLFVDEFDAGFAQERRDACVKALDQIRWRFGPCALSTTMKPSAWG